MVRQRDPKPGVQLHLVSLPLCVPRTLKGITYLPGLCISQSELPDWNLAPHSPPSLEAVAMQGPCRLGGRGQAMITIPIPNAGFLRDSRYTSRDRSNSSSSQDVSQPLNVPSGQRGGAFCLSEVHGPRALWVLSRWGATLPRRCAG